MMQCVRKQQASGPDHPRMFKNFGNGQPVVDVAVQHLANQVDAGFGEGEERDAERVVENLVDIIKWVLLVDDGVEKDAERPDVLFFTAIGFAL